VKHLPSLLICIVVGVIALAPLSASAHASLASSNPADKSQVATMPTEVSVTLTEPVRQPASISVMSADGTEINSETVTVLDDTATTAIDGPVAAGDYTMKYRIISVDGHTVTGTVGFEVLNGSAPEPTPSSEPTGQVASEQAILADTSNDSSTTQDAITIVGFSVVAMTGLLLVLRAGLRSAGNEDAD
jgi:methionine-rich copper-binding protein CopC